MMHWAMLLQSETLQVGAGALLSVNTLLLLRLVFGAGRIVQQIDGHEERIKKLEGDSCPFEDCPLKGHVKLATEE